MNFIEFNGSDEPFMVNMDLVTDIQRWNGRTKFFLCSGSDDSIIVNESYEDVVKKITRFSRISRVNNRL